MLFGGNKDALDEPLSRPESRSAEDPTNTELNYSDEDIASIRSGELPERTVASGNREMTEEMSGERIRKQWLSSAEMRGI